MLIVNIQMSNGITIQTVLFNFFDSNIFIQIGYVQISQTKASPCLDSRIFTDNPCIFDQFWRLLIAKLKQKREKKADNVGSAINKIFDLMQIRTFQSSFTS